MSYGKMPPQAYTKETLQNAFEWWSQQPEDLRNQIQDKDDLVGYYLRLHRGIEPPKNEGGFTKAAKESFSLELKGLVKNLDAFEGYEEKMIQPPTKSEEKPKPKFCEQLKIPQVKHSTTTPVFNPSNQLQFPNMSKPLIPTKEADIMISKPSTLANSKIQEKFFKLDEKSKISVAKTKKLLNLSSDEEALRALIALGKSRIKELI